MSTSLSSELKKAYHYQEEQRKYYGEYYHQEESFVCCKCDGRPIDPQTLLLQIKSFGETAEVELKFHDLRHTHATMMLEADANIKVLQERLGHSDIGTTLNTYSHVTQKLEDEAIDRFDKLFD